MRIFRREWIVGVIGLFLEPKKGRANQKQHKIGKCGGCGQENRILTGVIVDITTRENKVWRTYKCIWQCQRCLRVDEVIKQMAETTIQWEK